MSTGKAGSATPLHLSGFVDGTDATAIKKDGWCVDGDLNAAARHEARFVSTGSDSDWILGTMRLCHRTHISEIAVSGG